MPRLTRTTSTLLRRIATSRRTTPGLALVAAGAMLAADVAGIQATATPARAALSAAASADSAEGKPDLVSARLAARLTGHRVEITGERTETATTYANPDGTLVTEAAARPVRVRRGSGWVPADPTLSVAGDGSVVPAATEDALALSGGGSGSLVRLVSGAGSVALRWPGSLPAPTLSGPTATYANVMPNVDLKVTADVDGFEQLLVLKAAPKSPLGTIRIPLTLSGLTASQDAGGNIVFKDAGGKVVAGSSAPRMWGATKDAASGEPTRSAQVGTALLTSAGGKELDLTPDAAFLADPTVAYPVTIDPAVSVARAHWTYVDKAFPTTNYYNSADIARVGTWNGGAQVDRSIFSFDVSRFRGSHILSATLNTYENSSYSCTAAPVDLWDATAVSTATTWNAQPSVFTKWTTVTTAKGYSSACPAGPVGFAVTPLVQAWANNGQNPGNMELRAPNETANAHVKTSAGSTYPYTYAGQGDASASGSTLVKKSATQFTLTDDDGTATVWLARTVSGQTVWVVDHVTEPGSASTSSYTSDATGRVTRVLAAVPPGVSCTTLVSGCRALDLTYASTTTATGAGSDPTTWGDYAGRLASASFTAFDPAAAGGAGAMTTVVVARYRYDSTGHLRSAWDPRLDNGTNHLATVYSYDTAGRLATLTPPGLATWTLGYDAGGRLISASRPDPSGPTATTTVAYDVAFTRIGTGPGSDPDAPVELGQAATASWGQADVPATATAVFPPSHVPAGAPAGADWPFASLSYLDVNGRAVNLAAFGAGDWQVSVTEYDAHGNTVRSLSAGNRAEALAPTADTAASVAALPDSASRAAALDSQSVYSADGTEVLDTFGPARSAVLDDGSVLDARAHTHTDYDEGAPTIGGPYRLPTTITTSAFTPADLADHDAEVAKNGYDPVVAGDESGWTLRAPTRVTTVLPGTSNDLVTTTRYNAQGQVVESRLPAGTADAAGRGADSHSTVTTYYTAAANAIYPACGGSPGLAGLACRTGPAAQPGVAGLPDLPVTTYTYTVLSAVRTATETVGATTRTTTTGYDAAGRPATAAVAISPAQPSRTALPDVAYGYDAATGLPTTTTAGGITLTTAYDGLGRVSSVTDADGATTTSSYDLDGHLTARTDPRGTTTYTYDGTDAAGHVEHRGLATGLTVGGLPAGTPGTFAAGYDADGSLVRSRYPSGLVAATRYDDAGEPTERSYADATGTNWLSFTAAPSAAGQVRRASSPGAAVDYSYDAAGRLTSVADDPVGSTGCTTRSYGYDPDSNRTALASHPADADGGCSTATTPASTTHAYDAADRIVDTGYGYDAFGATTTVPAPDAVGAAVSIGYYANDLVASQAQSGATKSWTLDPARRLRAATDSASGLTTTNHYGDGGDSPSWIAVSDGSWTRNIAGPDGDLAAIATSTGSVALQLTNLHGGVVATAANSTSATGIDAYFESTEFGVARADNPVSPRYGWLGAKQRSSDALGGLVLMGVRLYDPATGRFLQVDPVPGGSANDYDYCSGDPINCLDLDGRFGWKKFFKHHKWDIALTALSFVPGLGAAAWAYRAYRVVRIARAARELGEVGAGVRATRATGWLAGRTWVGRGGVKGVAENGASMYSRGEGAAQRAWRGSSKKGRYGYSSNLTTSVRSRHDYFNFHIDHGRWL